MEPDRPPSQRLGAREVRRRSKTLLYHPWKVVLYTHIPPHKNVTRVWRELFAHYRVSQDCCPVYFNRCPDHKLSWMVRIAKVLEMEPLDYIRLVLEETELQDKARRLKERLSEQAARPTVPTVPAPEPRGDDS